VLEMAAQVCTHAERTKSAEARLGSIEKMLARMEQETITRAWVREELERWDNVSRTKFLGD
jgi:hypothetical protein